MPRKHTIELLDQTGAKPGASWNERINVHLLQVITASWQPHAGALVTMVLNKGSSGEFPLESSLLRVLLDTHEMIASSVGVV